MKKIVVCLLSVLLLLPIGGCWNYRGLDDMTIVSSVALDKGETTGTYKLSFEFIDMTDTVKDKGANSKIFEAEGKTLFEAVRDAKRKAYSKLYFGHTQVLILSQVLAKTEDLSPILDWFMRDGEVRETMLVAVSQEPTAAELLSANGFDQKVIGIKLRELLDEDNKITGASASIELYQCFDVLNFPGNDLAVSALRLAPNGEESLCEISGTAAFSGERLAGFLTPEETKYYLAAMNKLRGGIITFSTIEGGKEDVSLEIHKCKTQKKVFRDGDKPKVQLEVNFSVTVGEYLHSFVHLDKERVSQLESIASKEIKSRLEAVIRKAQKEYQADIFGFGELIHEKDFPLWKSVSENWETTYPQLAVEVTVNARIIGTGSLSRS